ncbi:hypothetical protein GCM10023194_70010 [Planotetraspora phitsanulokensis]|uniref:DUF3040 domain-containing protein n=1 Tax=Planotetraspora phitsanulokensis TaxID=575192 RepID=A0A8J3U2K2_9ACTN|nr:DUF3040 domain-containing protein [Planotetraspora phitsanulokensis]GII36797.1 hypothetical protein Pph01_18000 [Planotetraspora phitsanulokensis]
MAWSQDDARMLAIIEQHLTDEDPRLAARLESFNERVERRAQGRHGKPPRVRRPQRSTVIIIVSWLLIATLIATLLIMALRNDAAAFPM